LYAGAVAVPAYPPRPNRSLPRIQAVIQDAQAKVALTTSDLLQSRHRLLTHAPELENLQWIAVDDIPASLAAQWWHPEVDCDTVAFLQYTSGSTAAPKGLIVTHNNILHAGRMLHSAWTPKEDSASVSWLPLYHDMGLIGTLQGIFSGGMSILMSPLAFFQRPY